MATKAKGTVSGATHDIKGDNLVLAGTAENPITLSGDVYVKGDVIIKGVYTGKGTIYAEGNIYIAADITAKNSVFPYPSSPEEAHTKAQQSIASTDALGLAAKAIFIGKIGDSSKHDKDFSSLIYGHPLTDETRAATNVDHVFSWYPATDYFKLQSQSGVDCSGTSQAANKGSVYRIDAFLYGRERIEGASGGTGWVINGGVITEKFHFRPGGGNCVGDTGRSHVNFDYRMTLNDINILMELKPWFEKTTK